MVHYKQGNVLDAQAEALVNTVNEVGVMGKGVALMFRESFPESAKAYQAAAKAGAVRVGRIFVTEGDSLIEPKYILHFPTKRHWRHPSRIEWIRDGLHNLVQVIRERRIQSVALPPSWVAATADSTGRSFVARSRRLSTLFQISTCCCTNPLEAYQNTAKGAGVEGLTVPRALMAELIRRYDVLGLGCTNLEVQKLAWFVTRWIDLCRIENTLRLEFVANRYGPYADRLRHLLNEMDGSYLHCERRLSDAAPTDLIQLSTTTGRAEVETIPSQTPGRHSTGCRSWSSSGPRAYLIEWVRVPARHGTPCHCGLAHGERRL